MYGVARECVLCSSSLQADARTAGRMHRCVSVHTHTTTDRHVHARAAAPRGTPQASPPFSEGVGGEGRTHGGGAGIA